MRMYLAPADFTDTALGDYWNTHATVPALARALARGSRAADTIIRGHLGQPGATTLSAAVSPGAATLSVASTTNIDAGDLVDLNAGQERILVSGVSVSVWAPPFSGVVTLAAPTGYGYSNGTPVQGLYRERWSARGGSTNAMELSGPLTQEAQTAQAHAPESGYSELVRTIFLGASPVTQLISASVVYRFGGSAVLLSLANIALNMAQGWYRLPLGTYVPQGSDVETVYLGGFATVPDDVQEAVGLLAADDLSYGNPLLAQGFIQGKTGSQAVTLVQRGDKTDQSLLRSRAGALLAPFIRLV